MRRIKVARRQHLSEKATPVAENMCVVHQEWSWVGRGGFVPLSTSKHLWLLCKTNEFAVGQGKDTSCQGKAQAAFAHLDLKHHYLAGNFERTKSVSATRNAVEASISRSPAARFQTCSFHAPQSACYQLSHCTTQQSRVLPLCKHFTLKEEDLYKTSANFRVLLSEVLSQYQWLHRRLLQRELISLNPYLWVNTCVQADNALGFDQSLVNTMWMNVCSE